VSGSASASIPETLSAEDETSARVGLAVPCDYLFCILQADRPLQPSARFELGDVGEIAIGRTGRAFLEYRRTPGGLELLLPDPLVSSRHARILRRGAGWAVEDQGSKNGSRVDDRRCDQAALRLDSVIELGGSFLCVRRHTGGASDLLASQLQARAPALQTMSPTWQAALDDLPLVARSTLPILLLGESGTGKELMARAIHVQSGRGGPFVAVNCGAIPPNLVESTLFGHRRGAFSGAVEDSPGLLRASHGGTILLDELGELPLELQVKLLRALQEREVVPVGGTQPIAVDLRVVAATHADLGAMVDDGRFRADLLARVSGFALRLPPLRARREDLGLLVAALLRKHAAARAERLRFDPASVRQLVHHRWSLNIRELEQAIATAAVLAHDDVLRLPAPPPRPGPPEEPADAPVAGDPPGDPPGDPIDARLAELLRHHRGNISAVARELRTSRTQVHRLISRFKLDGAP